VTNPVDGPIPYRVIYSERVRDALRSLIASARQRGWGAQVIAAVKEMDRVLHIYPQIGQPLRDLQLEPARLWIAVFPPLVVKYFLDEEKRLVMVGVPIQLLPRSGL
jgi:hypothetical protein